MDEIREVLNRPKFAQRIHTLNTSVGELMESLLGIVEVIHDPPIERVIEHDPDDDTILACAVAS
jgi:predicted nucleic acid-binding protein